MIGSALVTVTVGFSGYSNVKLETAMITGTMVRPAAGHWRRASRCAGGSENPSQHPRPIILPVPGASATRTAVPERAARPCAALNLQLSSEFRRLPGRPGFLSRSGPTRAAPAARRSGPSRPASTTARANTAALRVATMIIIMMTGS